MTDVGDEFVHGEIVRIDSGSLMLARQKGAGPQLRTHHRPAGTYHDKTGQILIHATQSVRSPRSEARPRRLNVPGVHQQQTGLVIRHIGVH